MKLLLLSLLLVSCGKQVHEVRVKDSVQSVDGEAYTYMVIRFEFIDKVKRLCKELNPLAEFEDKIARNKEVASCTFNNLSLLNVDMVGEFKDTLCDGNETYESLTPEEKLKVDQICEAL